MAVALSSMYLIPSESENVNVYEHFLDYPPANTTVYDNEVATVPSTSTRRA